MWFVVAVPIYLSTVLGWNFTTVGAFFALWVIGYGLVQSAAPRFLARGGTFPHGGTAQRWVLILAIVAAAIAALVSLQWQPTTVLVIGLAIFGVVFAMNSALHSFLILAYSDNDKVALNVGFYYMANAGGRLLGTVASGLLYQWLGLGGALWGAVVCLLLTWIISWQLPREVIQSEQLLAQIGTISAE